MLPAAFSCSGKFVIDPLYSIDKKNPPDVSSEKTGAWLYGQYEYEAFLLERMFREKNEAKLKVGYTKYRRVPLDTGFFKRFFEPGEKADLCVTGAAELLWEGEKVRTLSAGEEHRGFTAPGRGVLTVKITVPDTAAEIPALFVSSAPEKWRYSSDGITEGCCVYRPARTDNIMPHHGSLPRKDIVPRKIKENVWDPGVELFCYVELIAAPGEKPELYVGESIPEMENNDPIHEEQTRELIEIAPGHWSSKVPLALRYIRVENAHSPQVKLQALFHPVTYKGAFAASEELLTRIWMHSAYTLRLCMMNFLNDGIKRDRLPWAGDLAVSLMGNACSFADGEIVRDTLSVLGAVSARTAHINTIVDYTLWHLISHDLYQKFFGDLPFLEREYPRLADNLDYLLERRSAEGFLHVDREGEWLFIDWVPGEKTTALQMLFIMALKAGEALCLRMKDPERAEQVRKAAEKVEKSVKELCFDRERKLFAAAPGTKEFTRHANMLAVMAGVADDENAPSIAHALTGKELPPVGTPYMSLFESMAIARCGRNDDALQKIREIWGGMLELGATSFWEGFDPAHTGNEHLVFYERPFGKSLCHAWSAGPLFLLPEILLRIRPEKDGWEEFSISPLPGVTVSAVIPVPGGRIIAECVNGELIKLEFPERCRRV